MLQHLYDANMADKDEQLSTSNFCDVVRVVQKSIGNGTFRVVAEEKPLNRLKKNLAWVITSRTRLSSPNGMSVGSGA